MISLSTYGLSFIAGVLSLLSPCVLPIVPILLGSALTTHRWGPYALAAGLTISFTLLGLSLASFGTLSGLDPHTFRKITAGFLVLFGLILLSTTLQAKFAAASAGLSNSGQNMLNYISTDSLAGQLILGLLLGVVWSPCVGPTLGAAIALASQGQNLAEVSLVMFIFGLGAGTPLILLGKLSQKTMSKVRNKLFHAGSLGKKLFGALLLISGLLILTGLDKKVEIQILKHIPDWWVTLTTTI